MGQSRLFCTVAVAFLALSSMLRAEGVHWQTNIEQARKLAAESDRLVLLHFYGSNCSYCVKLERNVFPLPQFAATLEANYVPVKIFADINEDLVKQYNIRSWPTDVIMTPEGKVLHTGVCPQDPREYTQLLYEVAGSYRQSHPNTTTAQRQTSSASTSSATSATSSAASQQQVAYDANRGSARSDEVRTNQYAASTAPAVTARAVEEPRSDRKRYDDRDYDDRRNDDRRFQDSRAQDQRAPDQRQFEQRSVASNERRYAEDEISDAAPAMNQNQNFQQRPAPSAITTAAAPVADRSIAAASAKPSTKMPEATAGARSKSDRNALPYGDLLPNASVSEQAPAAAPTTIAAAPAATQGTPIANSAGAGDVSKASAVEAAPTICLDGCCPVTLKETKRWVAGDQRWGAVHRGRIYLFANEAAQQRFMLDPDSYTPAASGHDAVAWVDQGKLVPGVRKYGGYFRGQVYLFASEESLQQFQRNSNRYAVVIEQAMIESRNTTRR